MKLPDLPDDIRHTLIRLPYRVGLYVSSSDKTGGDESDAIEMAALENIVTFYVEDYCKSEFAQAVMLETLNGKSGWSSWQGAIENVPEELKQALGSVDDLVASKEVVAFKHNLLEIALAVAQAYRELDSSMPFMQKFQAYFDVLMARIKAAMRGEDVPSFDALLNISRSERNAINLLAETLEIDYKIG